MKTPITPMSDKKLFEQSAFIKRWKEKSDKKQKELSIVFLKENYVYDPLTGKIFRLKGMLEIGYRSCGGKYYSVRIEGATYKRSRIAWFYMFGVWPNCCIDHINGDSTDDRINNLRDVTYRENNTNQYRHRHNYLPGTCLVHNGHNRNKKWIARAKFGGKEKFLGYFFTQKEAHIAWKEATGL